MNVLEKALQMLEAHALCDHCLGRQFALLGYNIDNSDRGKAVKLSLTLQASAIAQSKAPEGLKNLKVLAANGFSREAAETRRHLRKRVPKQAQQCFLCEGKFQLLGGLIRKALSEIACYEYTTFLVGVESLV